jgi:hypothetical protein
MVYVLHETGIINAYAACCELFKGKTKKIIARGSRANPKASETEKPQENTTNMAAEILVSPTTADVPPHGVTYDMGYEGGESENSPLIIKRKRKSKDAGAGDEGHDEDMEAREKRAKKGKGSTFIM